MDNSKTNEGKNTLTRGQHYPKKRLHRKKKEELGVPKESLLNKRKKNNVTQVWLNPRGTNMKNKFHRVEWGGVSRPSSSSNSQKSPDSKIKSNGKERTLRCKSVEGETHFMSTKTRASTIKIQLISCGLIAMKDHSFVTISHSKS